MGATHKRDLRSGHSIWQRRALLRFPERRLSKDTRCDVLVVGAGISGAMAAEQLTDAGLSVIVLDRRGAVRGSTLASTALLQYEIDTPLTKLAPTDRQDARRTHLAPLPARARCLARSDAPAGHRRGLRRQDVALSRGQCSGRGRPAGRGHGAPPRRLRSPPAFRQCRPRRVRHTGPYRPSQLPQSRSQPAAPGGGLSTDRAGARRRASTRRSKPLPSNRTPAASPF